MVQENRQIILSTDELIAAIESYRRIVTRFLPDGVILGYQPGMDNSAILTLRDNSASGDTPSRITLNGMNLLRPLIRFCVENNIMLPQQGKKSVIIGPTSVTLQIELDLNQNLPDFAAPSTMVYLDPIPTS